MADENTITILTMPRPVTELSAVCREVSHLAERNPEILKQIEQDQEYYSKEHKKMRILDKQWRQAQMTPLPGLETSPDEAVEAKDLILQIGKKKMKPKILLFFLIFRGYFGGFKAKATQMLLMESFTIHNFLEHNGIKMPGWSTIIDNVNQVSNETRSCILNSRLAMILEEELDDFKELTIDSTAVSGNVCWPTDSGILLQLVKRVWRFGQKLDQFGINNMASKRFNSIIKELTYCHKTICMLAGKKDSRKKIKKLYKKALKEARSALGSFEKEMVLINKVVSSTDIIPTKHVQLTRVIELMSCDLKNLLKVITYCNDRIEHDKILKAKEKIMSNSDKDAAYIAKGQREAIIGYKPQLGRSRNSVISRICVPEGNTADSSEFEPMVDQHIERTQVVPNIVSTDDGYAAAKVKAKIEKKGVNIVSISGAKGKKITSEEDWESDLLKEIRNNRSSVESLMFTIKYNHNFGRVMRRGIVAVRAELLEKVLSYNFCRIVELRKRKLEKDFSTSDPNVEILVA